MPHHAGRPVALTQRVTRHGACNAPTRTPQVGLVYREALDASSLLLRGCTLRKTEWVIGAVVFTGERARRRVAHGRPLRGERATRPGQAASAALTQPPAAIPNHNASHNTHAISPPTPPHPHTHAPTHTRTHQARTPRSCATCCPRRARSRASSAP
jgi:hypothetical protein